MLRNTGAESPPEASDFLNEVLSLNAQESMTRKSISVLRALLNEVLSLNAQELGCLTRVVAFALLNEVLSLNAQE